MDDDVTVVTHLGRSQSRCCCLGQGRRRGTGTLPLPLPPRGATPSEGQAPVLPPLTSAARPVLLCTLVGGTCTLGGWLAGARSPTLSEYRSIRIQDESYTGRVYN